RDRQGRGESLLLPFLAEAAHRAADGLAQLLRVLGARAQRVEDFVAEAVDLLCGHSELLRDLDLRVEPLARRERESEARGRDDVRAPARGGKLVDGELRDGGNGGRAGGPSAGEEGQIGAHASDRARPARLLEPLRGRFPGERAVEPLPVGAPCLHLRILAVLPPRPFHAPVRHAGQSRWAYRGKVAAVWLSAGLFEDRPPPLVERSKGLTMPRVR